MSSHRLAVIASYFAVFFGAGVWVPYFPLYLTHLGFPGWQIGVVIGVQPALRWGAALGWAYAADRWRIRHRVLVVTATTGMLFFVPLLVVRDFAAILAVLTMIGLLHGTLIPMLDATVMDHLARLGGNYGRLRLWGSIGFVVGSVVSAPLTHAFSVGVVPLLLLLPGFALVPALVRLPREQLGHRERFQAPWRLLTPPLAAFLCAGFLLQLSCGAFGGFFAVHTTALGFSDAVPGITFGLAVTAEVALLYWGRQVVERVSAPHLIILTLLITIGRWALTAIVHTETWVIALQLGHVFSFSVFHLAALRLLSHLVPPQSSTGGQALYGLVSYGIGSSAGLALAGTLVDRVGTSALFGIEAVVCIVALVPALQLRRMMRAA